MVSAKFIADFSSWQSAVDKAIVKTKSFESTVSSAEKRLSAMTDSFSGRSIIQQADLAAKSIDHLGGASTLTAKEQQRLNGIVTEAIAKYKALGQDAPKHLTEIAKATTPINSGFQSILGTLKSIGPAIGLSFSVGAITGFARSVGQFAGEMLDLEAQTGITTDRLQAFNFAGAGVGLTIDKITSNADQLAKRLGGEDKSVNDALEKLNLSAMELKDQDLDEVIFRIDDALVGVNNKFERARILTDLFGKSGAEMGRLLDGALRQGIKAAEDSGAVIDKELLKKADAFDDAWSQAWLKFRAYSVSAVGFASDMVGGLIDRIAKMRSMLPSGLGGFGTGGGFLPAGLGGFNETTGGTKFDINLPGGKRGGFIGPRMSGEGTNVVIGGGIDSVIAESEAHKAARKAAEEWTASVNKGVAATEAWVREMHNARGEALMSQDAALLNAPTSAATRNLQKLMLGAGTPGILPNLNAGLTAGLIFGPGALPDRRGTFGPRSLSFGQSLQGAVRDLPDTILRAIQGGGSVSSAIGSSVGSAIFDENSALTKKLTGGLKSAFGDKIGGVLGSVIPGLGSLLGPAISGLTGLFKRGGIFGGGEGAKTNTARDKAISEFTGITGDKGASQAKFRELAEAAGIAATEVDRLFSTGKIKNFDAEFARITEKMKAFTDDQSADQERLNAAIEKYGFTFDQLGKKTQESRLNDQAKELIEDWRVLIDSGIEITDVNNAMAEEINQYLQTAMKLGTEVPNAFRPILQKMLEQGTLTDEAGNAITDLEGAGIHFSETMTEGFDKVVKKLDELIEKLGIASVQLGSLPAVPSGLANNTGMSASDLVPIPMASGGRFRVNRPTLFLAGERGPEDAAFSGANRQFGDASSSMVAEVRALRSDFGWLKSTLPLALRDAVLLAR